MIIINIHGLKSPNKNQVFSDYKTNKTKYTIKTINWWVKGGLNQGTALGSGETFIRNAQRKVQNTLVEKMQYKNTN